MIDKIITFLLLIIGFVSSLLPNRFRIKFGELLGVIIMIAGNVRRKVALNNLEMAFPEKSKDEIKKILKDTYKNLGIVFTEIPALNFFSDEKIKKMIKFKNLEIIQRLKSKSKGIILLSGHYGNWEYVAYGAGLYFGIPILIVVKPQRNTIVDKYLKKIRTRNGNRVISMFNAAKEIIKTIQSNGAVAMLVDQSASPTKDIFVNFFGRSAVTYEAPASLALKFKIPIVYGFGVRQKDGTYLVELNELKYDDLNVDKDSIRELTQRHVKILENAIREHPDHWVWLHKRWKYDPQKYNK